MCAMDKERVAAANLACGLVERLEELLGRISVLKVVTGSPSVDTQQQLKRAVEITRAVADELNKE